MIDRFLRRIGGVLVDDSRRSKLLRRTRIWLAFLFGAPAALYCIGLLLAPMLLSTIGERNLTLAFVLYVPRVLFLFPLLLIFPLLAVIQWRLLPLPLLSAAVFWVGGMGWNGGGTDHAQPSAPGQTINLMTYNRGQHMNQSLQPFMEATLPDIIAMQEAPRRAAGYAKASGYEQFISTADEGEFTVLSRFPILSTALIEIPDGDRPMQPAARFEIDYAGTRIALYSVHFLSPRDTLFYYRRGAFLYGILGVPGTPWAEKRKTNQKFWDNRIDQARELASIIAKEPLPTLVVGDFNAPSGGYIHGIFLDLLKDAHKEAGQGFGYTFPGITRNPLSGGGPWMRIDYLFCDENWETQWCITEPDRPSQHRAVTAQFELIPTTAQ